MDDMSWWVKKYFLIYGYSVFPSWFVENNIISHLIILATNWKSLTMHFVVVHSLSHVLLFETPWTAAHQAPVSSTISWSLLKFISIELVNLSQHQSLFQQVSIWISISAFCILFQWSIYKSLCQYHSMLTIKALD